MEMAIFLILLAATFTALIAPTAAVVPPVESQIPASSVQQNQNSVMYELELEEAKIKIAQLESILDESMPNLNAKSQYIRETEKKIEDISIEIDNLTTTWSKLQHHSSRINALEEEELSRYNCFGMRQEKTTLKFINWSSKCKMRRKDWKFLPLKSKRWLKLYLKNGFRYNDLNKLFKWQRLEHRRSKGK